MEVFHVSSPLICNYFKTRFMLEKLIKPWQLLTGKARTTPCCLDSSVVHESEEYHEFSRQRPRMISPLHYLAPGSNSILKLFPSFSSFDLTTHSDKHLPISFEITVIYRHHWIFARDQFFAAPPNWVSLIGSVSQQRSGLTLCEVWFARVCSFHLMYSPDLTPSADRGCDSASLMADIRLSAG